jgi:hypothetical protein
VNEATAEAGRILHPLRVQHWLFSALNPWMWPVKAMASYFQENRKPAGTDNVFRIFEGTWSQMISDSLNLYRDLRDASTESAFFQVYGSMIALGATGEVAPSPPRVEAELRELPYVKEALSALEKGGYPEAVARISALVGRFASSIPLSRLETIQEFVRADEVLSKISEGEMRRLSSEAGVLALLEPQRTMESLPHLLSNEKDRQRALSLLEWAMSLKDVSPLQISFANSLIELIKGAAPAGAAKKSPGKETKEKVHVHPARPERKRKELRKH